MENFTSRQLDAIDALKDVYPSGIGIGIEDAGDRVVFDSIIARGSGLVELVDSDETPTGDAYLLTDEGADAFREDAQETTDQAGLN